MANRESDSVTLRRARARDVGAIADMEGQSLPAGGCVAPLDAWEVGQLCREKGVKPWLIEEGDGNAVGWFACQRSGRDVEIRRLLVHPDYRGAGFGSTAVEFVLSELAEGKDRLVASVCERDLPTCRWFASAKFSSRCVRRGWDAETDAVEFTLPLKG